MRHGTSPRRQRNRGSSNGSSGGNGRRGGNQGRTQVFDSNGPDVRIRGTAHQVHEKYMALAKDASSVGDIVLSESYLQYAEHYQRIINSFEVESEGERHYAQSRSQENASDDDRGNGPDLSLPASILGDNSNVQSQEKAQASTSEMA